MKYFGELKRAMEWLATKPDTLFMGQAVEVAGTAMSISKVTSGRYTGSNDEVQITPANPEIEIMTWPNRRGVGESGQYTLHRLAPSRD